MMVDVKVDYDLWTSFHMCMLQNPLKQAEKLTIYQYFKDMKGQ